MSITLWPMLLLAPVLLLVIHSDLARLTISNRLVLAALALAVLTLPVLAPGELTARLVAALAVFAILLLLFARGLMGGGDVKMLPAVVLFVPPEHWSLFALLFSGALLLGVAGVSAARAAAGGATGWEALDTPGAFPMGVSIGLSGLALPAVAALL
ncbi:prepilin peptidase [Jannaschia seohaensis]|uniref:Prepilin peptidase CpaA n=1 Tax=Jannaschia seohaensis TaxID=475081 RepID=A0A2Y9AIM1_9RHOB|nr:prepilin peptidase [Jannaschia seohaensis]PWJ20298.1 prepilin peptidase CpaA [Jannaschia seohaensis]SSA44324.1 prepilin peptidase CpaA [Jannaschia seohaensis]